MTGTATMPTVPPSPVTASFGATGVSASVALCGGFSLSISGTFAGTVQLQRSFDNGGTWHSVEEFTATAEKNGMEHEDGILYRLECTAYTSGTAVCRLAR